MATSLIAEEAHPMNIIKVKDYEEMSRKAALFIIKRVRKTPNMTLGLATGGTPEGMYQNIIMDYQQNNTSYSGITTFNLDEYVGLDGLNPNSYRYYMNTQLFNHINIPKSSTYIPLGNASDSEKECARYEQLIKEKGGIDLQVIGIGGNGHIAFNEPGTSFQSRTHLIQLTASTRSANSIYFNHAEEVPTHAITMGISTILDSKEILLLASGEEKIEAIRRLQQDEISEDFPASILKKHPNITIIADEVALSGLN